MPAQGTAVDLGDDSMFSAASFATYDEPWSIAFIPGTPVLVTTMQGGTMSAVDTNTGRMITISGAPEVDYGGQGGLGDVAFLPSEASSTIDRRTIYLSWAEAGQGDTRGAVVGRGTLVCQEADACNIEGLNVIWRQAPKVSGRGHYSHKIAFSPDGQYMFVASGDRQKKEPAQDLSNTLGTVLRLNLDGTPAAGNPFASRGSPSNQIWSYGHRNILGLAFDPEGRLWDLEHGPAGGDELNLVQRGANYGWPVRSNGDNYNGTKIPNHTPDDGFTKPAIFWTPVIAPGDMIFYTGSLYPVWQGDVFIANLKEKNIVRVEIAADGQSATEAQRYAFPNRLRDIAQGPDGAMWVIEDGEEGRLLRLLPKGSNAPVIASR